jgi:hypothetical protein
MLALLLAACPGNGGKANNPTPPPDAAPVEKEPAAGDLTEGQATAVDRLTEMTIDLSLKLNAAGADCAALAAAVNTWADAYGAEQAKLYEVMATLTEAQAGTASQRASAKLGANKDAVANSGKLVTGCEADAEFAKAWGRLGG